MLRVYDRKTIEFKDGNKLRDKLSHKNKNDAAANQIEIKKIEPYIEQEIEYADKKTVENIKEILGLRSQNNKFRPLSYYLKDKGKEILSSIGLELIKYQKKRKTYYKLCKKS